MNAKDASWHFRLLSTAVLASACGEGVPRASTPARAPEAISSIDRYMPLKHDTVYAYETLIEDTGEKGVLMIHVTRPRPDLAELNVGGRVQRLDLGADGIRHATGGYLLKLPLAMGARYKGQFGEVRVTSVDRRAQVMAQNYVGCIETIEEATTPVVKKVTTLFCPEVGIVSLYAQGMVEGEYASERATLRSFGPKIDLGAD